MKIGIICAMEEELESILATLSLHGFKKTEKTGFTLYSGSYNGHEVVLTLCGIGKVNAAISTQNLINTCGPDYVINVGVAGSLSKDLTFGDVVVATDLVQHDIDVRAFQMPLGQIPRMDVFSFASDSYLLDLTNKIIPTGFSLKHGRIATGDQFIDDSKKAMFIHEHFQALACEMEGGAVAHACYINKVPFLVVRSLSDMAGQDGSAVHSFVELTEMAANRASSIVKQLLNLI